MNIVNFNTFRTYIIYNIISLTFHPKINITTTSVLRIRIKQCNTLTLKYTSSEFSFAKEIR